MTAIAKRQMFQQKERKHIQKYARFPAGSRSLVVHIFACCAGIWSPTWCLRRPKDKRSLRSACSGWCPTYSFCGCPQRCVHDAQGRALACLLAFRFALCQALPMKKCAPNSAQADGAQSAIWRDGDEICVRLLRRKNRPQGSGVMRRRRSCVAGVRTCCAVHTLWERFFALLPDGTCPWAAVSPSQAIVRLRRLSEVLGIPDASAYGTHGFRRGHAEVGSWPCACNPCRCTCPYYSRRTCASAGIHWLRFSPQASGEAPPSSSMSRRLSWRRKWPTK